jgi:predicted metal-dependent peptidase
MNITIPSIKIRLQRARTSLLLDHPFFGSLLFRLKWREVASVETMATDGVSLFYNREFVMELPAAHLVGVLAHEALHPALQHHIRRGKRCPKRWNQACDYAINLLVLDAGLSLPDDALVSELYRCMSAEQIYNLLESSDCTDGGQARESSAASYEGNEDAMAPATPGGFGQVLDAPPPETNNGESVEQQAATWEIAVSQAQSVAKLAGRLPAGIARSLESSREAQVDWRELLRRAWSSTIASDYCWTRPNRRHVWQGLFLPGVHREGVGEVVLFVDCSGSINKRQLGLFEAEVRSILDGQRPEKVYVVYFDAEIQKVDSYEAGQPINLSPAGGGGTDFCPCFTWVEEQGLHPQVLIFLTDLYGTLPEAPPAIPVIWASNGRTTAPFGEVVPLLAA